MCSQYSQRPRKIEQQTNNKIDSICHSRVVSSLPADSIILGVPPPRQTSKTQRKTMQNTCLKRTQSLCLPVTAVLTKKQASITDTFYIKFLSWDSTRRNSFKNSQRKQN
jgi:hypothetical protein